MRVIRLTRCSIRKTSLTENVEKFSTADVANQSERPYTVNAMIVIQLAQTA